MKAVVIERGETTPTVHELPQPDPEVGEVLVRTLRVGIDGTDHEVITGNHGGYPEGEDYQVLGHECVGVVVNSGTTDLKEGRLVVPTVRIPPNGESNAYFERGEPDMAPADAYHERGIVGAHGFMREYFTSDPNYLVQVPETLAEHGFLVEPISNSEKAIEHAFAARSAFNWQPESAIVLGNGPLGLLAVAMLNERFDRTYCLGRRDRPDPTIDIIERLNATYVDSRETPVDRLPETYEAVDFLYEATGYPKHAFEAIDALAPNGIGALLGIPDDWSFEVDGGRLHSKLVLENKGLVGSVNSNIGHYEAAIESIQRFPDWLCDALITGIYSPDEVDDAFETGSDRIKTVVEFDTL